jgi:hypothetical protein
MYLLMPSRLGRFQGDRACSPRRSLLSHGASKANRGPAHGIAVDREADAGCLGPHFGIERRESRYPDHLTGEVYERTTGVPGIDRRAGLDDREKSHTVCFRHAAPDGRDDALGHTRAKTERVPDREREVADLDPSRIGEGCRARSGACDSYHRQVHSGVSADQSCGVFVPRGERDHEARRVAHDVRVRYQVAPSVEHDARAKRY